MRANLAGPNNTRIPRWPLAATRIYLGVVFAVAGVRQLANAAPWVKPGQTWPAAMKAKLADWSMNTPDFYQSTVAHLVKHATMLAHHVAVIHLVLGLALIAGLFTRITGALAVLLLCNYMAAAGAKPFSPAPAAAFTALALVVALGNAGLVWGLDGAIDRRWSQTVPR
jgi:uncharacterized membrane protein YphA (DoxX/SURF4 family)